MTSAGPGQQPVSRYSQPIRKALKHPEWKKRHAFAVNEVLPHEWAMQYQRPGLQGDQAETAAIGFTTRLQKGKRLGPYSGQRQFGENYGKAPSELRWPDTDTIQRDTLDALAAIQAKKRRPER